MTARHMFNRWNPLSAARNGLHLQHPVWLCAFRPFFALSALWAVGSMLAWLCFWLLGWPLPAVPGGALVWHAHELLLGFALAAVAGFSLTAVPEFTDTAATPARPVRTLVVLWLLARLAFWLSGWWPVVALAASAALHLAFLLMLAARLAPPLWRAPQRQHLAFLWAVLALAIAVAGFYWDALLGHSPMRWLYGVLHLLMLLIVVAMSRVSMRIVNASIEAVDAERALRSGGTPAHTDNANNADSTAMQESSTYLARPPRRHLAMLCITALMVAQWWPVQTRITGWLALAASAAVLGLLNDWHVGRALLRRWPLMLYAVYLCMAAGYGVMGLALLADAPYALAGLHLLTAGALGLNIFVVIAIAGYTHSGLDKDGRAWVPTGAVLLVLAAVVRALAYAAADWYHTLIGAAGLLWCSAYTLLLWHMLPVWTTPRRDGASGCAGVMASAQEEKS